jgi:transcriptional regulator with XRE-family HTH domain
MQNNLQQIRKRAGLNQEQLGQIIGVTKGHVSKIESGQVGLNEKLIKTITRHFNVSAAELLGESAANSFGQLDHVLMQTISGAIDRVASKRGLKLSREEFLKLSVDLYNYVQKHRTENEKIEVNTALAELFMNTKANAAS